MKKEKFADITDVARNAGVSPATVSRTLNHPNLVKASTKKRIQDAINSTGYIRNRAAQAIHGKKSGTIGLIVPTLDNAIFANLIQAFSDALKSQGFTMLIATHDYDLDEELNLLRTLLSHRVEGVAMIGVDHRKETYSILEKRNVPTITLWNYSETSPVSCVGSDNFESGFKITDHLIGLGHRKISAIFPNVHDNDRAKDRLSGVLECLSKAKIQIPKTWLLEAKYSISEAKAVTRNLLSSKNTPTAIIAGNDVIAQGVIYAASELELNVPKDVSVAGIGDFSGSADIFPSITTVRMHSERVAKEAAEMLIY